MRYYITGANGFIGKHMVKYLKDKGHEVTAVGRDLIFFLNEGEEYEFIHLGAYGNHYHQKHLWDIIDGNIHSVHELTDFLAIDPNCKKLYNISTSAIQLPTDTLYSVSKRFGELMVESYNDPRFVNIRPYSVYGPGEADHRFIPTVIRALHSGESIPLDLHAQHDWIYIDDFIEAMFKGETDIGTGESYSNWAIVGLLQLASGKLLNFEDAKLRSYDTKDWKALLPAVPHRTIYEGLKQTYEWFTQKNLRDKQEV